MAFQATEFLESTNLEADFERLQKSELLLLADHLKVPVNPRMKKNEIKTIVAEKLIQEKLLSYPKYPFGQESAENFQLQLEIKRLEVQIQKDRMKKELDLKRELE